MVLLHLLKLVRTVFQFNVPQAIPYFKVNNLREIHDGYDHERLIYCKIETSDSSYEK